MNKKQIFLIIAMLAIFIPVLVKLKQAHHQKLEMDHETIFRLPVSGFNPRDFVRGRYTTLQIDWPTKHVQSDCMDKENKISASCGICLVKMTDNETIANIISAKPRDPSFSNLCQKFIQPVKSLPAGRIIEAISSFHMDERAANYIDRALSEGHHKLTADIIFMDKNAHIKEIYVDGIPYHIYIKEIAS